jgi:hypothetical protein
MSASGYRFPRGLRACRWIVLLAALVPAGWGGAARADELDLSLGLSSSSVLRGVLLGDLTARSMASYNSAAGWLTGLGVAALQSPARHDKWDAQLSLKFGYARVLDADWAWQSAYTHHAYPGSERLKRYAHHELAATLAYRELLVLSVAGLRNARATSGESRSSVAYEIVASHPFPSGLSATAGVGYREALHAGTDHAYGHAGISVRWGSAQADLLYIGTDAAAKRRLGPAAADRWVGNLTWRF